MRNKVNNKLFDLDYVKQFGNDNLKIELKKGVKGTSIFATKKIKKGNVVAYYKFCVFRNKNFVSYNDHMYSMEVYTKNGNPSQNLIGDICDESLEKPKRNISFWAYFSNEPNMSEKNNCYLDINIKGNYRNRKRVKIGDFMIYKLRASRDILPGEEIIWCYGPYYTRKYETSCEI